MTNHKYSKHFDDDFRKIVVDLYKAYFELLISAMFGQYFISYCNTLSIT